MSGFFNRVAKMVTFGSSKRLVGRDLEGNKYFELPAVNGGKMKRVVEYKVTRDIADYTSGTQRLPVQWTTWLSHTRANPPSLDELQTDRNRRERLQPMIAAIEEREREERIRQGYLAAPDDGSENVGQIAGPSSSSSASSTMRHSGLRFGRGETPGSTSKGWDGRGNGIELAPGQSKINAAPSFVPRAAEGEGRAKSPKQQGVVTQNVPSAASASVFPSGDQKPAPPSQESQHPRDGLETQNNPYPVPTPETPGVAPPSPTVDPSAHSSPEELRRLSEEDTKRRIKESEQKAHPAGGPAAPGGEGIQGVDVGGSAFKPRRRRG